MIPLPKVYFAEDAAAPSDGGEVLKIGEGVGVRRRNGVEAPEVSTRPPAAVAFPHHMEWGRPWAVGPPDDSVPLQLQKFRLGRLKFLAI